METLSSLGGILAAVIAITITLCFVAGGLAAGVLLAWSVLGFIVTPWQTTKGSKTPEENASKPSHATSGH